MSSSPQTRLSQPVFARSHLGIALKKTTEIGRVLEPQLVADFVGHTAREQQQALGLLHQAFHDQTFGRQVGNPPADIIEPCLGNIDTACISRQGPMLPIVGLNKLIETVEDFQVLMPGRGSRQRITGTELSS